MHFGYLDLILFYLHTLFLRTYSEACRLAILQKPYLSPESQGITYKTPAPRIRASSTTGRYETTILSFYY